MARALPPGRAVRRRHVFGLFDDDGWAWATAKAMFWLLVIILTLGYIPDRAYYFVVSRTIDLGLLGWSPVNLCPPENGKNMPCPVPAGAIVPWQASAPDAALPQPRTGGAAAQLGKNLLYIGGSDGTEPSSTTYLATIENGEFGAWSEGPGLPAPRTDAAIAILSGTAYLVGGEAPDGTPTNTVWSLGLDPDTSALGKWQPIEGVSLPEPRSGAAAVAVTDGIVVAGGIGPDGKPSTSVWKSTIDAKTGKLTAFKPQPSLPVGVTDATAALEGTFLWVYGGSDEKGPTNTVQRAAYGAAAATTSTAAPAAASPGAAASPAASAGPEGVVQWATSNESAANLPGPRSGGAGWAANGALYMVGGTDGSSPQRELYWALPDAGGNLTWHHLDADDLPEGIADGAPVVSGANVFVFGGTGGAGPVASSYMASLAPQEPFFRAGLVGVTVPGLQIGGEIGQQLGYLAAAGVGTGNFAILVIVGVLFNHRPQVAAWWERRKAAREAKAPSS